jgi:hypothetical protein
MTTKTKQKIVSYESMRERLKFVLNDFRMLSGDIVGEPSGAAWQDIAARCTANLRDLASQVESARAGRCSGEIVFPSPDDLEDEDDDDESGTMNLIPLLNTLGHLYARIDLSTLRADRNGRECGNAFIPQTGDYYEQDMLTLGGAKVTVQWDVPITKDVTDLDWDKRRIVSARVGDDDTEVEFKPF